MRRDPVRLVYSTAVGSVCATCGWPANDCKCSSKVEEKVPSKLVVKLRIETKGRGGKMVTVLDGLPRNSDFLEGLGKELKKLLGTGGMAGETLIELQGDHRAAIRRILSERNFLVKG
ncbi:MAG TPA: translation initiation factor [Thermoanaerobaculia bacterium]|nr:translation initiation factor [Thermoanaerobaculia bacterium]